MGSRWSKQDIKTLTRLWPRRSGPEVAELLNRPYTAVKKFASRLGLKKGKKRKV